MFALLVRTLQARLYGSAPSGGTGGAAHTQEASTSGAHNVPKR